MSHFRIFPVDFDGSDLGLLSRLDVNEGSAQTAVYADGIVDPVSHIVTGVTPGLVLETFELEAALGIAGVGGAEVDDVVAYNAKIIAGGARSSSGDNISHTFASCFVAPQSISISSAGDDKRARMTMAALGFSSSGADPLTVATNASLPTPSVNYNYAWTQGPVSLNGSAVTGFESAQIDFGLGLKAFGVDGNLSPKSFTVVRRQPMIRLRGVDLSVLGNLSSVTGRRLELNGTTGFVMYLRKYSESGGGAFVANGTAEHIKIVAASGVVQLAGVAGDTSIADLIVMPEVTSVGTACWSVSPSTAIT
jgi:hypothetical protein